MSVCARACMCARALVWLLSIVKQIVGRNISNNKITLKYYDYQRNKNKIPNVIGRWNPASQCSSTQPRHDPWYMTQNHHHLHHHRYPPPIRTN